MRWFLSVIVLCIPLMIASAEPMTLGGAISPDGKETIQVDMPLKLRIKNVGGRDGAGLCVFTSINHAALWQNELRLFDFQKQMKAELGGGWPGKVDQMIAKYGAGTPYLQYEGSSTDLVKLALKCGKLPSITWNGYGDPHYRGQTISHMVNIVHCTESWWAILDNNFIGENDIVWCRPADGMKAAAGKGGLWVVFLLEVGPPPPIPVNTSIFRQVQPSLPDDEDAPFWTWYTWKWFTSEPKRLYLYGYDGSTIGAWDDEYQYFKWYYPATDSWSEKTFAPFDAPALPDVKSRQNGVVVATVRDYGLPLSFAPWRDRDHEIYTTNGKPTTRDVAWKLIGQKKPQPAPTPGPPPKLVDDSTKIRVTVFGTRDEIAQVRADWAAAPEWCRKCCIFQCYIEGTPQYDSMIVDVGLRGANGTQVVIQSPADSQGKGKVLHRGPYAGLTLLTIAIDVAARKSDPNYDSGRDPDLNKSTPSASAQSLAPAGGILAVLAALAAGYLTRKDQQ